MKKLGTILIALIILSFASESFAQKSVNSEDKSGGSGGFFMYGFKTGLNISSMVLKDDDEKYSDEFSLKIGFHAGPIIGVAFTDLISLQTGTILTSKGFKWVEEPNDYETYTTIFNPLYLEIPINVKFTFPIGIVKIYTYVGPYIGIGLAGKATYKYTYEGDTDTDDYDIEWGSDPDDHDLKRIDFGMTGGAGVQIKFILIGFHYDLGMMNVSPYTENGATMANRNFGFSVGVIFGGGGGGGNNNRD